MLLLESILCQRILFLNDNMLLFGLPWSVSYYDDVGTRGTLVVVCGYLYGKVQVFNTILFEIIIKFIVHWVIFFDGCVNYM